MRRVQRSQSAHVPPPPPPPRPGDVRMPIQARILDEKLTFWIGLNGALERVNKLLDIVIDQEEK